MARVVTQTCFMSPRDMKCVLVWPTGDGECVERVQPDGERRGLAEVSPAGTDEPQ